MNSILKNRIVIAAIALVLAIICGSAFFITTRHSLQGVTVLRLNEDVPQGTQITKEMVKEVKMNNYNLPEGVLHNANEVVNKYAKVDLVNDDILTDTKVSVSLTDTGDTLSNLDGTRHAISVMVKNLSDSVSDKLRKGDIVSCIVTQDKKTVTPAELNYLEVVAITDKDGKDLNDSSSSTSQTVTVLATQKQSEILSNYDANGEIHFALVYRGDKTTAQKFLDAQTAQLGG